MPKLSVIIPCYNDHEFLAEAIKSVHNENLPFEVEILVVNDGSSATETLAFLEALNAGNRSVTILNKTNGGLSSARNHGIKHSKGDYIMPLDADDLAEPKFMESAVELLEKDEADIVFGDVKRFGCEDRIWNASSDPKWQFIRNGMSATAIYKRAVFEQTEGYDETMLDGYEDWEFWLHAMRVGMRFRKVSGISFYYRIKERSMVTSTQKKHEQILTYIRTKHLDYFVRVYKDVLSDSHDMKHNYRRLIYHLVELVKTRFLRN